MPPRSLNSASKRECHRSWSRWWWWWYRIADTGTGSGGVYRLHCCSGDQPRPCRVGAIELDGEVSSGWESYLEHRPHCVIGEL